MDIFDKYPEIRERYTIYCQTRCSEILSHMVATDEAYEKLRNERSHASMELKASLKSSYSDELLEKYSDAIYAQEIYELDAIYKQAFCDALYALKDKDIL